MKNRFHAVKRPIMLILVLIILLSLTGCAASRNRLVEHPSFKVQYIRTNGYHSDITYPIVRVIGSADELKTYYEQNKDRYDLSPRTSPIPSDLTVGFLDAAKPYDQAWFSKKVLVLVLLEEGSGSNRHLVKDIVQGEQSTQILIERIVPSIGTADMAEWHILIELDRKEFRSQTLSVLFT